MIASMCSVLKPTGFSSCGMQGMSRAMRLREKGCILSHSLACAPMWKACYACR